LILSLAFLPAMPPFSETTNVFIVPFRMFSESSRQQRTRLGKVEKWMSPEGPRGGHRDVDLS
jgi:hypothetical protein